MSTSSEEISRYYSNSGGKPDSNLANDALHLGGIEAEDYATKKYVQEYHNNKENTLREEINQQDTNVLNSAKAYADLIVANQDFSSFAKLTDVQALNVNLSREIIRKANEQKEYTDLMVNELVNDVNDNFDDVNTAINTLNNTTNELFQSVSNGKQLIAGAITDKGVSTSANDTFSTMATNIRNIPTDGGGGIIPPGYIDTSDATAIASDIVLNKTAYVNGEKIAGTLITPQYYEENDDNPYPETVAVDLVYGSLDGDIQEEALTNNEPTLYAISCDRRILVEYDATNQKIITKKRNSDGYYVERNATTSELITPEYTLQQLGITLNEDLTVSNLVFSPMNTRDSFSGYECNLAILVKRTSSNITGEDVSSYYVYVYVLNTFNGEMQIQDEVGDGYTKVNKYEIVSDSTTVHGAVHISFSSFDSQLLVILDHYFSSWGAKNAKLKIIDLYKYKNNTISYFTKLDDNLSISGTDSSWQYCRIKFLNTRLVELSNIKDQQTFRTMLVVLNSTSSSIIKATTYVGGGYGSGEIPIAFSADCLHAIKRDGKLYDVIINYETGEIILNAITNVQVVDSGGYLGFDYSGKYIFVHGGSFNIFYIDDFETTTTLRKIVTYNNISSSLFLSDLRTVVAIKNQKINMFYPKESKELIGLKYNGQMFYSELYKSSRLLTATQADVRAGKTFIGIDGIPETGTMEVIENE